MWQHTHNLMYEHTNTCTYKNKKAYSNTNN